MPKDFNYPGEDIFTLSVVFVLGLRSTGGREQLLVNLVSQSGGHAFEKKDTKLFLATSMDVKSKGDSLLLWGCAEIIQF